MNDPDGPTTGLPGVSVERQRRYIYNTHAAGLSSIDKSTTIRNPLFFARRGFRLTSYRDENTIHFRGQNKLIFGTSAFLHSLDTHCFLGLISQLNQEVF